MIESIEILLFVLIVVFAFLSLWIRDLMGSVIIFGAYSFLMCLIWAAMGAVDVAFTEAAVGAGVSTVFFIAVIYNTTRTIKFNPLDVGVKVLAGVIAIVIGFILLQGIDDFPAWGDAASPVNSGVASYYVEQALHDTAVPNIVTAVLADYRAFDTMFETCVVFVATIGIIGLLRRRIRNVSEHVQPNGSSLVIRVASRFVVPFIQIFALYVVAHGHHSPGGGFQGGVLLGASLILLAMGNDMQTVLSKVSEKWVLVLSALGVVIFAGYGLGSLFFGAPYLDYSALAVLMPGVDEVMARSHAMLIVEIGVAMTVMCGMIGIYAHLVSDGKLDRGL